MTDHVRDAIAFVDRHYPGRFSPKSLDALDAFEADYRRALSAYSATAIDLGVREAVMGRNRTSDPAFPPTLPEIVRAVMAVSRVERGTFPRIELVQDTKPGAQPEHAAFCFAMIRIRLSDLRAVSETDRPHYFALIAQWEGGQRFTMAEATAFLEALGASAEPLTARPKPNKRDTGAVHISEAV